MPIPIILGTTVLSDTTFNMHDCPLPAGSTPQFLLHPRNITLLDGSLYAMECVALHTSREFSYFLKMFRLSTTFDYPEFEGIPVLTIGSVSLEDSGKMMVCYGGVPFMILSPSERGHLTVHCESTLAHYRYIHTYILYPSTYYQGECGKKSSVYSCL
jgi:hypothetical protein